MKTYTIKPLEWESDFFRPIKGVMYKVVECQSYWIATTSRCEVVGDGLESKQAAKAAAEAHWRERLEQCLEEVK